VFAETEVDQPAAKAARDLAVGADKRREVVDRIDLPNQIVARDQAAKHVVQSGDPRAQL